MDVIKLEESVSPDVKAPPSHVALVANDKTSRHYVNTTAFKFYSKFAEGVLSGDVDGDMPLDSDRASPILVQKFCTWLKHHETVSVSKISIPLPRLMKIDDYYTDPWDIAFIRQHFVGEEEDMTKAPHLYDFALLAVYLQVKPLTEMIATYFAWHIKKGCRETCQPTQVVSSWYGRDASKYTVEDVKNMTGWVRDALCGLELPKRRTMESDDEYSTPPCKR